MGSIVLSMAASFVIGEESRERRGKVQPGAVMIATIIVEMCHTVCWQFTFVPDDDNNKKAKKEGGWSQNSQKSGARFCCEPLLSEHVSSNYAPRGWRSGARLARSGVVTLRNMWSVNLQNRTTRPKLRSVIVMTSIALLLYRASSWPFLSVATIAACK